MTAKIEFCTVDYQNPQQGQDLLMLLDAYAQDPMGGGAPLSASAKATLLAALSARSNAFSIVGYVDGVPACLANCFETFSTFKAKPVLNIHDFVVLTPFRKLGLSQKLLSSVAALAQSRDCCKLTLELLEGNTAAKQTYVKFGFEGYELDPEMGKALFWEKVL